MTAKDNGIAERRKESKWPNYIQCTNLRNCMKALERDKMLMKITACIFITGVVYTKENAQM